MGVFLVDLFGCVWEVKVYCICPVCIRQTDSVMALDKEQALSIATEQVIKKYGKQGEAWNYVEVHMKNTT